MIGIVTSREAVPYGIYKQRGLDEGNKIAQKDRNEFDGH